MAAKKAWQKFIKSGKEAYEGLNFNEILVRVPPNQMEKYVKFAHRNRVYRERMMKYPRFLPTIDWEYYRTNVRDEYRDWVKDFEKQYEKLNQIFNSRHEMIDMTLYFKDIDKEEAQCKKEIEEYQRASCARMEEYQKEMEKVKNYICFTEMTWEEYCILYPKDGPDFRNRPTFWPHLPDEQTPGPAGPHAHLEEEGHDESGTKKPPPSGGDKPKGGGSTGGAAAASGKSKTEGGGKAAKDAKASDKSAPKAMAEFAEITGESKHNVVSIFSSEAKPMEAKIDNEVYGKVLIVSEDGTAAFEKIKTPNAEFTAGTEQQNKVQEIGKGSDPAKAYKIDIQKSSSEISYKEFLQTDESLRPGTEEPRTLVDSAARPEIAFAKKSDPGLTDFYKESGEHYRKLEDMKEAFTRAKDFGQFLDSKGIDFHKDLSDKQIEEMKEALTKAKDFAETLGQKESDEMKRIEEMKKAFAMTKDSDQFVGQEGIKLLPKQSDDGGPTEDKKSVQASLPDHGFGKDTTPFDESQVIGQSSVKGFDPNAKLPLQDEVKFESTAGDDSKYDITVVKGDGPANEPTSSAKDVDKKVGTEMFKGLQTTIQPGSDDKNKDMMALDQAIGDEACEQVYANAEIAQVISQLTNIIDSKLKDEQGDGGKKQIVDITKAEVGSTENAKLNTKEFQEIAKSVSHLLDIAHKSLAEARVVHKDRLKALEAITKQTSKAALRAEEEAQKALISARKLLKRAKLGDVELDERSVSMARKHAMLAKALAQRALELRKETEKVLEEIEKKQQEKTRKPKE